VKYHAHGTLADYVNAANDATLIAVQLEDREAIDSSFRKMLAAGRTPGTPATAENLRGVLPRLLSASARS
jgi:2-keto-3-deoxy-L-rhamnonate aldolase RhmA